MNKLKGDIEKLAAF